MMAAFDQAGNLIGIVDPARHHPRGRPRQTRACGQACRLGRPRRGRRGGKSQAPAAGSGGAPPSWPALSGAVALLTSRPVRPGLSRAAVLGDVPPAELAAALEVIAAGCLEAMSPADGGAALLEAVGLLAARQAAIGEAS